MSYTGIRTYIYTRKGMKFRADHIHKLVRDEVEEFGEKFKYRCVECNTRLKRLSGVLIRKPSPDR